MQMFDSEIVRMHQAGITMPQAVVLITLLRISHHGLPAPTLAEIVKELKMPFSTASRIVWELIDTYGLASYGVTKGDRRKKPIVFNRAAYEKLVGLKGGFSR